MDSTIESTLADGFPEREVVTVEPRAGRPGNRTVAVRFADDKRVFLKITTDGNRERVARETAATRYAAAHCDIRVPQVLAADHDGDPPYLATAPLAGTPAVERWDTVSPAERTELAAWVGRGLAAVHAARFDRHGRVTGGDVDGLGLESGSWTDVLRATVEARARDLFADRFTDLPGRLTAALSEVQGMLDDAPAALLHGDANRHNCVLDGSPGFIDWENALVGDPALELVRAESQWAERPDVPEARWDRRRRSLREGYRERAGTLPDGFTARRPIYRAVTFLLTARTFELWAPDADEPTDELAAWVRAEFDRRLGAFGDERVK